MPKLMVFKIWYISQTIIHCKPYLSILFGFKDIKFFQIYCKCQNLKETLSNNAETVGLRSCILLIEYLLTSVNSTCNYNLQFFKKLFQLNFLCFVLCNESSP